MYFWRWESCRSKYVSQYGHVAAETSPAQLVLSQQIEEIMVKSLYSRKTADMEIYS